MNPARVQELIYKGYGKEAKALGFDYALYRGGPRNPLAPANYYGTLPCAFLADQKGAVANKYQTPTWFLRADGNLLQRFDFLVGTFGTFYVASMQPQLPMEAIQCNSTVSIGRTSYAFDPVSNIPTQIIINYAEGLPMFKQYRREDVRRDSTGQLIGSAVTHWRAFIPLPNDTLHQDDVITDENGILYTVDAPDFTSAGYAASIHLATL